MAKEMAKKLNYIYIDTGAMYRAITLFALRNNLIANNSVNEIGLVAVLPNVKVKFNYNSTNNKSETFLNDVNIESEIRGLEVSNHVSKIAQIKAVRAKLVELQREMGKSKGLIMDGRDIGTVVFPEAELKIFMTADYKIRAQRRFNELQAKGDTTSFEEVLNNITSRDMDDTSRTENPLIQAKDAIVIDNSNITPAEQLALALDYVCAKID